MKTAIFIILFLAGKVLAFLLIRQVLVRAFEPLSHLS
ncbi:MAG: hypothetical protein UY67_C0011G0019 [Candidatus Kaiserbacteria bacterium GW2011_GWA2_52_12]|uniref:Uncharacterized protein n=1 Tax=Candidatus Kaiserbacteria bacterium GW2011_GWA2_52_12 TaxID=1618671 RepID=A0A0G1Z8Y9_9BACT|nr:MAG: hypothetical protein UY67_C0011G0019 [Candidatus Kaiserbacteria bacterium GW2011_GWA2_52_12]